MLLPACSVRALCVLLLVAAAAVASPSVHVSASVDWSSLNATTLSAVDPQEFRSLSADQFSSLHWEACVGLQAAQLAWLMGSACSGLPEFCLAQVLPAAVTGLTPSCVSWMPVDEFHFSFGWKAVAALPLPVVQVLTAEQFALMANQPGLSQMAAAQLAEISTDVCARMVVYELQQLEASDNPPLSPAAAEWA